MNNVWILITNLTRVVLGCLSYLTLVLVVCTTGYSIAVLEELNRVLLTMLVIYTLFFHVLPALWVARDVQLRAPDLRWRAYSWLVLRYGLGSVFFHYLPNRDRNSIPTASLES